ncbi:MAG: tyrosine-type recombinase/integrase, partial [Firmicutes bacterium]|nr:tyrosine-type recombinase/integrase [Bacillota bacterium]
MTEYGLRQYADDFVSYKRTLGYIYDGQAWYLNNYVNFAESRPPAPNILAKTVTDDYIASISSSTSALYGTVSVLREFSRYLRARGFDAYVIPPKIVSHSVAEDPYFFMPEEIDAFFRELDKIEPNKSFKGRELVFPALFRLLYCCGLRCKEVRTLECSNVHMEDRYIDIMQSKGPKSRRIFISGELADYLTGYDLKIRLLFPDRKYYFPHGEKCYESCAISGNFRRFWMKAFPDFELKTRPRAYDFRHHFAWSNLN